jgi:hypothetical protein
MIEGMYPSITILEMSSAALAARENWQADANAGGAAHEFTVEKAFKDYFATPAGAGYEFISKPKILENLFIEEDYKRDPSSYKKPEMPMKDDTYYDEQKNRFFKWDGQKWIHEHLGMVPDGMIRNTRTGKAHLLEDKKQNAAGNAHERACRYGMPKIVKAIQKRLKVDGYPVSWIFAGGMTTSKKYILEIAATFPDENVLLIKPTDDASAVVIEWFNRTIRPLLN